MLEICPVLGSGSVTKCFSDVIISFNNLHVKLIFDIIKSFKDASSLVALTVSNSSSHVLPVSLLGAPGGPAVLLGFVQSFARLEFPRMGF